MVKISLISPVRRAQNPMCHTLYMHHAGVNLHGAKRPCALQPPFYAPRHWIPPTARPPILYFTLPCFESTSMWCLGIPMDCLTPQISYMTIGFELLIRNNPPCKLVEFLHFDNLIQTLFWFPFWFFDLNDETFVDFSQGWLACFGKGDQGCALKNLTTEKFWITWQFITNDKMTIFLQNRFLKKSHDQAI